MLSLAIFSPSVGWHLFLWVDDVWWVFPGQKQALFRAVCSELSQPRLLPPAVLRKIFPCLSCPVFIQAPRTGWGGSWTLWVLGSSGRSLNCQGGLPNPHSQIRVWTLGEVGSHVLNAFCFWDSYVAEFHPITNTLKMGLPTPLVNLGELYRALLCTCSSWLISWALKNGAERKPVCAENAVGRVLLHTYLSVSVSYCVLSLFTLAVLSLFILAIFLWSFLFSQLICAFFLFCEKSALETLAQSAL